MATCPSTRVHQCHLANTTELAHPLAHWSPQSKWQMDRFSHFCTAYGRKRIYFTTDASIHQNCPFPLGIWTSLDLPDTFGPCEPTTQTAPLSVQPSLHVLPLIFPCTTKSRCFLLAPESGNDVIYDVIIWVQDGNCKKWLERILVLVRSTI